MKLEIFSLKESENMKYQNSWNAAKTVFKIYSIKCLYIKNKNVSNEFFWPYKPKK